MVVTKKPHKPTRVPAGMTVNVDPDVQAVLTEFCGDMRIKKVVLARLITWFCAQDRSVQTLIVDPDAISPEDIDRVARMVLERFLQHGSRAGPGGVSDVRSSA